MDVKLMMMMMRDGWICLGAEMDLFECRDGWICLGAEMDGFV